MSINRLLALLLFTVLMGQVGSASGQQEKTIYISADMEGVAGLSGTQDAIGRRLMAIHRYHQAGTRSTGLIAGH